MKVEKLNIKDCLKNYRSDILELNEVLNKLENLYAHDSVQSSSKFPYSKHDVTVSGFYHGDNTIFLLKRRSELEYRLNTVEKFVNQIPQFKIRKAVQMYFMWPILTKNEDINEGIIQSSWDHKPKWDEVADKIGNGVTAYSLKSSLNRYLKL